MQDVLSSTTTGLEHANLNGEAAPTSAFIPRIIETTQDVKPAVPVSNAPTPFFQEAGEGAVMTDTTMSNSEAPQPTLKQPRASRPYKRRKKSPVASYRNFMVRTADQLVQPEISLEEMPFDKTDLDDIQAAVQAAQTKRQIKFSSQLQNHAAATEKMKKNYDAALGRANRRAFEANERHRMAIHDYASLKKSNKIDIAESIASVRAEMTEEHAKALKAKNFENSNAITNPKDSEPQPVVPQVNSRPIEDHVPPPIPGAIPSTGNGLANGSANGLANGSINSQSEITDLRAKLDISTQLLEQEQFLRKKEAEQHLETMSRLSNEIQSLKNAQVSSQPPTATNEKAIEELQEFAALKGDIMQLARQFPTIFPVDSSAAWSSAKVGMALQDLVHARLKQEAQFKVHELLDQSQA